MNPNNEELDRCCDYIVAYSKSVAGFKGDNNNDILAMQLKRDGFYLLVTNSPDIISAIEELKNAVEYVASTELPKGTVIK